MSDEKILSCFKNYEQHFLVTVTIHKARNLSVANGDTYVVVNLQNDYKRTSVYQNSDCPYFNEVCK